jgi:hypothetical protein
MSLCIDDLVPDFCAGKMQIPLDSANVTDYPNSKCYTWQCSDYAALHGYCHEDKRTGAIACAIRESGGEYACPGKVDGQFMVNAYDPDDGRDHRLTDFAASGAPDEPCGVSVPLSPPPATPSRAHQRPQHQPHLPPSSPDARTHRQHHRAPGRAAATRSCIDCRPAGEGWSCGSCT